MFPCPSQNLQKRSFNAIIQCKTLTITFNKSQEHDHFEDTLTSDNIFLKQIELCLTLKVNESNEIINEVLDSMFNLNNQSKHNTKKE